jgi:hypothetical protein
MVLKACTAMEVFRIEELDRFDEQCQHVYGSPNEPGAEADEEDIFSNVESEDAVDDESLE